MHLGMRNPVAQIKPVSYDEESGVLVVRHPDGEIIRYRSRMATVLTWCRQRKSDQYYKYQIHGKCTVLDVAAEATQDPPATEFPPGHPLRREDPVDAGSDTDEVEAVDDEGED